jgi:hypothetical protein
MVAFGTAAGGLYLSHIPMFHSPHDMQAIFSVHFENTTQPVPAMTGTWTFLPGPCSLDDLVLGNVNRLHGTLYQGDFEQGGQAVLDADAVFDQVITAVPLNNTTAPLTVLTYQLFGVPGALYLYHPITQPPGFDQILAVAVLGPSLVQATPGSGLTLTLAPPDEVTQRLVPGSQYTAQLPDGEALTLKVVDEVSALVGPMFDHAP